MGSIALEEYDLLGDSKYRSYMTQVDRALRGFESTSEWADLIAALTKLNRVLLAHMKYPVVPRRVVISKRLAQCMHPALPSGVHQKALETYDIIFKCMGTNRLAAELFIYSAGLFPLLANAALTVRSALLTVYETHFVPLGSRLRPGLNGFLSGLLPGLEEGSDHYERTSRLLEAVAEAVGTEVFYSAVWECVATNATIRLPAITFVLAHCSKRGRTGQGLDSHLLGSDHDVMCRALCLALRDSSALVQRAALDLLLIGFPVHQPQFARQDMVGLVTSVLATLLRRDMSLNRRLFSWLLGTEINPALLPPSHQVAVASENSSYFLAFSLDLLVAAVLAVLEQSLGEGVDVRPYRVVTVLLDKPEIGPLIIDKISLDVFRTLHHMFQGATGSSRQELIKTANLLFAQLETSFVWAALGTHFTLAVERQVTIEEEGEREEESKQQGEVAGVGSGPASLMEVCTLIMFLLEVVSIETYVETSSEHLPSLSQTMLRALSSHLPSLAPSHLFSCLLCLRKVLARVQPAWSVWDVAERRGKGEEKRKSREEPQTPDIPTAREVTESSPGSPASASSLSHSEETKETSTGGEKDVEQRDLLQQSPHESLVAGCRQLYTALLLRVLEERVVATPREEWAELVEGDTKEGSREGLSRLLMEVLGEEEEEKDIHQDNDVARKSKVELREEVGCMEQAFSALCNGLVELSSMPKYQQEEDPDQEKADSDELPMWLLGLLVCCKLEEGDEASIRIQLTAIHTLLELVALLQSVTATQSKGKEDPSSSRVLVTMQPLISSNHLQRILRTNTVGRLGRSLWAALTTSSSAAPDLSTSRNTSLSSTSTVVPCSKAVQSSPPSLHLQCVSLLHRLVALSPRPGDEVEGVVAASIRPNTVEIYRRFALLWHLSRELPSPHQTLDLCLFKMVAGLDSDRGAVRALCHRWVEHCLSRGDCGRLLEPIFLSLLAPSTARVSVLHATISQQEEHSKETSTPRVSGQANRVVSVTCTESSVLFHLVKEGSMCLNERAWNTRSKTGTSTALSPSADFAAPTFPTLSGSVVNPFALVSSESEFLQDPSCSPEPSAPSVNSSAQSTPRIERREICVDEKTTDDQKILGTQTTENIVDEILDELVSRAVDSANFLHLPLEELTFTSLASSDRRDSERGAGREEVDKVVVHPLHSHLLLYMGQVDSKAALHHISSLSNLISVHPRLAVSCFSTTNLSSPSMARSSQLVKQLARHRRAVLGKSFSSSLPSDATSSQRSAMLVEVVISLCLYYLRSYYPPLVALKPEDILANREVQLAAVNLLTQVSGELVMVVKDNGKAFSLYMADLLARCKVQKVVLHSLLAGVHAGLDESGGFTQEVLNFNSVEGNEDTEAFLVALLKLVLSLIMLEEVVNRKREEKVKNGTVMASSSLMRYQPDLPLAEQPMFLAALLAALRQTRQRDLHCQWTALLTSTLPFLGPALTSVVTAAASQIWTNLASVAASDQEGKGPVPADYLLTLLEALGQLLSYCLLDSPSSGGVTTSPFPSSPAQATPSLVAALAHVLGAGEGRGGGGEAQEQLQAARRALLSLTPRLIVALCSLWRALQGAAPAWLLGSPKGVRATVLELLSPLATVHSTHFLAAVGVAWAEVAEDEQGVLVELVSSLRCFPTASLIGTLRQVVKSPPPVSGLKPGSSLDLACLQFFSSYLAATSNSQLGESWSCLRELLKDCASLSPPSVMLGLSILHQFVVRGGAKELEKKESKEVQEMASRLVEAVAGIAGSRLEAGTWLRGSRGLREEGEGGEPSHAAEALSLLADQLSTLLDITWQSEEKDKVLPLLTTVMYNLTPYLHHHTSSSLPLLRAGSALLASLSEYQFTRRAWRKEGMDLLLEKEFFQMDHETLRSWVTTTDNLMTHDKTTFKELLARIASLGQSNISIFSSKELEQEQRALLLKRLAFVIFCSDVDQYQKQMPDITDRLSECLRTVPVSPAVQAAVFLCFRVLLLRMSAVHITFLWPVIITEMVLVFSAMEHELAMEQPEFSEHLARVSQLDSSWVAATTAAGGAGLGLQNTANNPAWLGVYLAVCKLLDQAAALPASLLPQFQMYRWAFVREGEEVEPSHVGGNGGGPSQADFVPHIARISRLLEVKLGRKVPPRPIVAGEPLLTVRSISSLADLAPWFATLSCALTRQQTRSIQNLGASKQRSPVAIIERIIELDFLEELQGQLTN